MHTKPHPSQSPRQNTNAAKRFGSPPQSLVPPQASREARRRTSEALPILDPSFRTMASIKPIAPAEAFPFYLLGLGILAAALISIGLAGFPGYGPLNLNPTAAAIAGWHIYTGAGLAFVLVPGAILMAVACRTASSERSTATFSAVLTQGRPVMTTCSNVQTAFGDYSPIVGSRMSVALGFRPDLDRLTITSSSPLDYEAYVEGNKLVLDFAHHDRRLPLSCSITA